MHTLYTYGYLGGTLADLHHYADAGVLILDIRYSPTSRNPLWRKYHLIRELGESYRWNQDLGNVNYKTRKPPFEMADMEAGLDALEPLLRQQPVLILCACRDWHACHRELVAEAAQARWPELVVRHLAPGEALDEASASADQPASNRQGDEQASL